MSSAMLAILVAAILGVGEAGEVGLGLTEPVDQAWFSALERLDERDFGAAEAHLKRLHMFQRGLQVPNLFGVAEALLLQAEALDQAGFPDGARMVTEAAAAVAPDSPAVPLQRYARLTRTDGGLGERLAALADGLALQVGHLSYRLQLVGRLAIAGLLALLWAAVIAGAMTLMRHGRRLRHDAEHLLPAAARGLPMVVLLLVALVVAPLAVGVGLVPMSLGWCVVLGVYLSWRERVVLMVLALGVAATPWLNARYAAALAAPGSAEEAIYACFYGRCAGADRARVEAAAGQRDLDPLAKAALGVHAKRLAAGEPQATQGLRDATLHLGVADTASPDDYVIAMNLVNAAYVRDQRGCERTPSDLSAYGERFGRAMALHPAPAEGALGQSVVFYQSDDPAAGARARNQARALGGPRARAFLEAAGEPPREPCVPGFDGNRHLLDALPAVARLEARLVDRVTQGAMLVPFGYLLAGVADARFVGWLGLLAALALALTGALRAVVRPAFPCSGCGRVACGRCRRELRALDVCEECLFLRVQGGLVDSRDRWLRKRDISRGLARRAGLIRGLSVVLPGSGLLLTGRPITGGLFLLLFLGGALLAGVSGLLLPFPGLVGVPGPALEVLGTALACVAWALSLTMVVRRPIT